MFHGNKEPLFDLTSIYFVKAIAILVFQNEHIIHIIHFTGIHVFTFTIHFYKSEFIASFLYIFLLEIL